MIHICFEGYTYHLFKDFMKFYHPSNYSLRRGYENNKNRSYKKYQMIATNYDI